MASGVPQFDLRGLLPTFRSSPTESWTDRSPFRVTVSEIVASLGTSAHRLDLIDGLLDYRRDLAALARTGGFQWVDGSFVENNAVPPNDIDVVTWVDLSGVARATLQNNIALFSSAHSKLKYGLDVYVIDVSQLSLRDVVDRSTYWASLFGHRRKSFEWKGFLQLEFPVPLNDAPDRQAASSARQALTHIP